MEGSLERSSLFAPEGEWGGGGLAYCENPANHIPLFYDLGLYTDESPGLKVDPVVVLVLSLGFIFSVVALHGKSDSISSLTFFFLIYLSLCVFICLFPPLRGWQNCSKYRSNPPPIPTSFLSAIQKVQKSVKQKTDRYSTVIAKLTRKFTS